MSSPAERFRIGFSCCVGAMDLVTGLLLMLVPAATVGMFGAEMPAGSDVTMRMVGAFVCGVGLSYFVVMLPGEPETRSTRTTTVWLVTVIIRVMVAACIGAALSFGRLDPHWIVVAGSDALVATVQLWMVTGKAST